MYGEQPKTFFSPLDHEDHPELNDSPLCGPDDTAKFQSLIGTCQWVISLCRFDIAHAIMSLSRCRHCPRQGHIDRLKQVCGYIRKFLQGAIRFRMGIPNPTSTTGWRLCMVALLRRSLRMLLNQKGTWSAHQCDTNLLHNLIMGRSATGLLHFLNQTPIDHFSKCQNQVKLATYGSEFMAARQAVEQIIDLRYTLRMLGVLIDGPSSLFGDNKSVVTSSTIPHSGLNKCWNALSYHKVCEAVASIIVQFEHIPTTENPVDILTKALLWHKAHVHVEPLFFWKGETTNEPSNPASGTPSTGPTSGE